MVIDLRIHDLNPDRQIGSIVLFLLMALKTLSLFRSMILYIEHIRKQNYQIHLWVANTTV